IAAASSRCIAASHAGRYPGCLGPDRLPATIPLLVNVGVPEQAGVALVGEPDLDARLVADRGSIPIETDSNVGCGLEHLVDKVTRRDASDVILLRYGLAARGNELVVVAVEGGGQLNLRCHQGSQAFMFSFANQIGRSPLDWHDLSPQPLIVANSYSGWRSAAFDPLPPPDGESPTNIGPSA